MTRKALFLDRDGVINVDVDYAHRPDQIEWIDGIFDVARAVYGLGYALVVVTNQAGIGRGYYSEADFRVLSDWMCSYFAAEGGPLAGVYFCPFHAEGTGPYRAANHPDRKPNPGMLRRAAKDLDLDLTRSLIVGDQESDIAAGRAAGLAGCARFAWNFPVETGADIVLGSHIDTVAWLHAFERGVVRPGEADTLRIVPLGGRG